jgi:hypothetical protein
MRTLKKSEIYELHDENFTEADECSTVVEATVSELAEQDYEWHSDKNEFRELEQKGLGKKVCRCVLTNISQCCRVMLSDVHIRASEKEANRIADCTNKLELSSQSPWKGFWEFSQCW